MESQRKDILTRLANAEISVEEAYYQIEELDRYQTIISYDLGYLDGDFLVETIERIAPFVNPKLVEYLHTLESISHSELKSLIAKHIQPEYLQELSYLGYNHLTVDEQVLLITHGISPGYIWDLQTSNHEGIEISMVVTKYQHVKHEELNQLVERVATQNDQPFTEDQKVKMKVHVTLDVNMR